MPMNGLRRNDDATGYRSWYHNLDFSFVEMTESFDFVQDYT